MPQSIRWCRRRITRGHPNFRFQVADLHNGQYNPRGSQRASEYTFPYEDSSFDVAVAASLFTHLQPFESDRYLEETARTLRPGGRLVGTWYLVNEEAEQLLDAGKALRPGLFAETRPPLKLDHHLTDERGNRFRAPEEEIPEHLIAVYEEDVRAQHERAGLRIVEIRHGSWPGRDAQPGGLGQDVVIAERG
jgi:SAM-dependent methyltransferase